MGIYVEIITWLFIAVNSGRIFAYIPQLISAWNCKNGAASVSRVTWGYFAVAHLTGLVYAIEVIDDSKMALMFLGNLLACVALVAIVTWKKMSYVRAPRATHASPDRSGEGSWGKPVGALGKD